ncbi:hypothetical protein BDZ88DRAFT_505595 [Geranomyces variabilis]|nr:hypothetical protein BDZ88DRAFT_505595 [Geranomyces variabilis]KAJ3134914.1 hypothetical protein HDU90_004239 [Geranomyces variabilis]
MTDPEHGTQKDSATKKIDAITSAKRGLKIPLPLLLLLTTILIATAITLPIALLLDKGATSTVNDIVALLRANYVASTLHEITTLVAQPYEVVQADAANTAIRSVIDASVDGVPIYFYSQNAMLYAWEQSIVRSSFVFTVGFYRLDNYDNINVAALHAPGLVCVRNTTDVAGRTCQALTISGLTPSGAVDKTLSPFLGQNPPPQTTDASGGWNSQPFTTSPLGTHLANIKFEQFSTLLAAISTTENSVIAVWLTQSGALLATNQPDSVLDPASVATNVNAGQSYLPTTYPNKYITSAAASLIAAHGAIGHLPASTSDTFSGPDGGKLFVESRVLTDSHGLDFTILIAIPERDLLGSINEARKKVLVTSIVVAVSMMGVVAAASFLVALPIRRLTAVMLQCFAKRILKEAAKDFRVFETMLSRFAAAIEQNKKMARGNLPVSTGGSKPSTQVGPTVRAEKEQA